MNSTRIDKRTPVRLEQKQYEELHHAVLQRDGWRCQFCGAMTNLEVHHQQFRSHSGEDCEENLITAMKRYMDQMVATGPDGISCRK